MASRSNRKNAPNNFSEVGNCFAPLSKAVKHVRAALCRDFPPDYHEKITSLCDLGRRQYDRFKRHGRHSDLHDAVAVYEAALELCPQDYPFKDSVLNDLACCLLRRFKGQGSLSDLYKATELHQAALELCPPGHPNRSSSLNNLALCFQAEFEHSGQLSDLNKAIEVHQASLDLCPSGHSNHVNSLNNLADCFWRRFEFQGQLFDLNKSIELHQAALAADSRGHSRRNYSLNGLANCLWNRFERQGQLCDLNEAIELLKTALNQCSPNHPLQHWLFNDLGFLLQSRFEHPSLGQLSDLKEAIELHQAALSLRQPGHVNRYLSLSHLAYCLQKEYEREGLISSLTRAHALHHAALDCCPRAHHHHALVLRRYNELILSYPTPDHLSIERAFSQYSTLSSLPTFAISQEGLRAARSWATYAEKFKHPTALPAYKCALAILDQLVNFAPSASMRLETLQGHASTLSADAFSCGLRCGASMAAVELLEHGRGILWAQLARFRTPIDALLASGSMGKELAERMIHLSRRIRQLSTGNSSSEHDLSRVRTLQAEFEDTLSRIRTLPDFSRFLLPPTFADICGAAKEGPVIVVNSSVYSCDALIILANHDPVHVPLSDLTKLTKTELAQLVSSFRRIIDGLNLPVQMMREIVIILRDIWSLVVEPIVEVLERLRIPHHSRIWWCPAAEFTALPLHAAGPYARGKSGLSSKYISSYTPTCSALLRARAAAGIRASQITESDPPQQRFVAIGQGKPYEGKELQNVDQEIEFLATLDSPTLDVSRLSGNEATVQAALDALTLHSFVHLACHGVPNSQRPLESSFAMADGPLELLNIIDTDMRDPQFAFLSACHTVTYNNSLPDEVIHLAAGMQFVGFRSVIGTMWSVDDTVITHLVKAFYQRMLGVSGRLDGSRAAIALHEAVLDLQRNDEVPFEQRIVFIHIGI